MQTTLTIPKQLTHGDELIIVRRKEYEKLQKHLVEVRDALQKISRGEKELHNGKIKPIHSLSDLDK
ncbi:MAG: hypothetical protein Q7K21_02070 [Elusimicrobiota bacterium]|nr:hypothetical protein [Elusimicrobiota bacterium]